MNIKNIITNTIDSTDYFRAYLSSGGFDEDNMYMFQNAGHQAPSTRLHISMPTECPCCGKVLSDRLFPIFSVNNLDIENKINQNGVFCDTVAVYKCSSCDKLFIVCDKHELSFVNGNIKEKSCELDYVYPYSSKVTVFSNNIKCLSPEFVKIYNQSELAENSNLNEICGMGYRRALEYLVDAYVRKENPSASIDADMSLSKKIKTYIKEPKILSLAEKATWLGNDFTHIVKKHPHKDIKSMKGFIEALVGLIEYNFRVEEADLM